MPLIIRAIAACRVSYTADHPPRLLIRSAGRRSPGGALAHLSFGPFRLVPTQFLVLEGDKPVPLGGRALELLLVLLERRRVGQQAGYDGSRLAQCFRRARQSHGAYVSAASASRDGGDGKRFIVSIPGRGYRFSSPAMPAHEN